MWMRYVAFALRAVDHVVDDDAWVSSTVGWPCPHGSWKSSTSEKNKKKKLCSTLTDNLAPFGAAPSLNLVGTVTPTEQICYSQCVDLTFCVVFMGRTDINFVLKSKLPFLGEPIFAFRLVDCLKWDTILLMRVRRVSFKDKSQKVNSS